MCGTACRYTLATLPRELVLNSAMSESDFDFLWVPDEPQGQENAARASNGSPPLPLVQHGHTKSPVWEGQGVAKVDFPRDAASAKAETRDYSRAYPDRCVRHFTHLSAGGRCVISSVHSYWSLARARAVSESWRTSTEVVPRRQDPGQRYRRPSHPCSTAASAWSSSASMATPAS